ncbi:phosphate propanoyltransferase [Heliorestis acidaminivorans]|uniref:Phosphate propanoyltransferase n=1 Tax=Heliorestis acidaminivorans TaxID=553427 RepID=A0A6I0F0L8_9FIRM|nr:phosphate propanoyltransferase [Heliorestis acidaminivorans]KAB2954496.1 phosphate propanoyltransferase [Heliorestis acidaminivorans]
MSATEIKIAIGVSNRHIHMAKQDMEILFGKGHEPKMLKHLSQPGQYASEEVVALLGPKGTIENVRLLMPLRKKTQIEVSLTDCYKLGIAPVIRDSGDIEGTPGLTLVGPKGQLTLKEGVIVAARHIHLRPKEAELFKLSDGDRISVQISGSRALRLDQVLIRVDPSFASELHIDTDEANAGAVKNGELATLLFTKEVARADRPLAKV